MKVQQHHHQNGKPGRERVFQGLSEVNKQPDLLLSQLAGQDMPRSHPRTQRPEHRKEAKVATLDASASSLISIISLCCCALNIYQSLEVVGFHPESGRKKYIAGFVYFQFAFLLADPAQKFLPELACT